MYMTQITILDDTDYDGGATSGGPEYIIDRYDTNRRPEYPSRRPEYPSRPNIYQDKNIYHAWNYDSGTRDYSSHPRPPAEAAHRPFDNNGPPIVDKSYVSRPNR